MSSNELTRISRREFVGRSAVAGGVLLGGQLLAACGGGTAQTASASTRPTGPQKKGGVLRVGISGGGSTDSIDPATMLTYPDNIRCNQLYDFLIDFDQDANTIPALAEEMTPNNTGDVWTVRLRDGVEFHDGKTLTADDLIYSFQSANLGSWPAFFKTNGFNGGSSMKKLDDRTVRFTLAFPFVTFRECLMCTFPAIRPVNYNPKNPVGTGPFKFKSFSPGVESVFVANPNYWRTGPYVDQLQIIDFTDDTARMDALLAGQVDVVDNVPAGQLSVIKQNTAYQILSMPSANWQPFTMRVDRAPFNDVRVRQAFRLIQDRQQLLDLAVAGQGSIANDLHNRYSPDYPTDIPQRHQDIEQAKSLLKQAGREGVSVNLVTAPLQRGVVEMSEVFAQQATQAGVNVQVTKLDPTTLYNSQYLQRTFSVDYFIWPLDYLSTAGPAELPGGLANECHYNNPRFTALYREATGTLDQAKRREIVHAMQEISYNDGGYMIPYFANTLDAASTKVVGWQTWKTGMGLNGGQLRLLSLA